MLLAFDEIMKPLESEQVCSQCKNEFRQRKRECGVCGSTFWFPDPKSMEDRVEAKPLEPYEQKVLEDVQKDTKRILDIVKRGPFGPRRPAR